MPFITPVIEDSPLNFVQFVDAEFAQHPSIHNKYEGQDWEERTYPVGQADVLYKYKAEMADPIHLEFHTSFQGVQLPTLRLFKIVVENGQRIARPFYTFPMKDYYAMANNTAKLDNGVDEPLITSQWLSSWTQVPGITPGNYYLVVTISYNDQGLGGGAVNRSYSKKSAHIELKMKHPKTIGMACYSKTNKDDSVFNPLTFRPFCRFEGALLNYNPDFEDTSYENQLGKINQLSSVPGATKTLVIGGGRGIPQWVKAWANYAMSCDYKAVDGIEITKDSNSQWEPIGQSAIYPLGGMSMQVREANKRRQYTTIAPSYVTLFTKPSTYPYEVDKVAMQASGGPTVTLGGGFVVDSDYFQDLLPARVQAEITRQGLKGYVSFVGNEFRYINKGGEQYSISQTAVLNRVFSLEFNPALASTLTLTFTAQFVAVDWGDGSYQSYSPPLIPGSVIASHTYTNLSQKTVKIFHSGTSVTTFSTNANAGVLSVSGRLPSNLIEFSVINAQLTVLNTPMFALAKNTLQTLNVRGNKIATLVAFQNTIGGPSPFTALSDVGMRNNRLSTAYVDEVLTAVNQVAMGGVSNGNLNLQQQSPLAPPTSKTIGSPYYSLVNTYNWTVTTD